MKEMKIILWITCILLISVVQCSRYFSGKREYCEWESFNATCPRDSVIVMTSAKYGRMALGRCVTKNYGHIGCGTDVMPHIVPKCSGRTSCLISVISLHNKRSCPKDFKSYLQAEYSCLKVNSVDESSCNNRGYIHINGSAGEGYLASNTGFTSRVGTLACPWVIEVEPYQLINLTLIDFSDRAMTSHSLFGESGPPMDFCVMEYAFALERNRATNYSICGGRYKEGAIYVSHTNKVELYVNLHQPVSPGASPAYFLIKYQAIGCPPMEAPYNTWIQGNHDHVVIQCNDTDEAWFLSCEGTSWIGDVGNCSDPLGNEKDWGIKGMFKGVASFPFGLLIVVALGVAIGVAIGLVMLVSVLAYMKRRRRRRIQSRSNYLLKNISGDGCGDGQGSGSKQPTGGTTSQDCEPMLAKRSASLSSHRSQQSREQRSDYSCAVGTWGHNKRPSKSAVTTPSGESNPRVRHMSSDDILNEQTGLTSQQSCATLPRGSIPRLNVFTTFKPPEHIEGFVTPDGRRHECFRTSEDSPYYFKLDVGDSKDTLDGIHKPDIVHGCLECQDRLNLQQQHSVV